MTGTKTIITMSILAVLALGAPLQAVVEYADNFDTGNIVGDAPVGWQPSLTPKISTDQAFSGPNSVEMLADGRYEAIMVESEDLDPADQFNVVRGRLTVQFYGVSHPNEEVASYDKLTIGLYDGPLSGLNSLFVLGLEVYDSAGTTSPIMYRTANGSNRMDYPGGGVHNWNPDVWNTAVLNFNCDTDTIGFTINGVQQTELGNHLFNFVGGDQGVASTIRMYTDRDGAFFYTDDVLLESRPAGDADWDGDVDLSDLSILATNWDSAVTLAQDDPEWDGVTYEELWDHADFTENGIVDLSDLSALATNWQVGVPASTVPEPMTMSLLAIGGIALLRRRR